MTSVRVQQHFGYKKVRMKEVVILAAFVALGLKQQKDNLEPTQRLFRGESHKSLMYGFPQSLSGYKKYQKYSRLSLSRIPRDSLKYFEISVVRHIRFAELRKK